MNVRSLVLGNVQTSLMKEFEQNFRVKDRDVALSMKTQLKHKKRRSPKKDRDQKLNFKTYFEYGSSEGESPTTRLSV
jgi:hypothetical protein